MCFKTQKEDEQVFTSVCSLVEEAFTAGCSVGSLVSQRSVRAEGVEQLLTHLVPALTELHRHYRHFPPANGPKGTKNLSLTFRFTR